MHYGTAMSGRFSIIVQGFEALRKNPNFTPNLDRMVQPNDRAYHNVKLLLVISEIIETIEASLAEHDEEVADVLIRMLDYAYLNEVDIDREISAKLEKNRNRPYKHNRNF
jgi:NTP pyrophosphatase (non-canonical NTP hydrolase)